MSQPARFQSLLSLLPLTQVCVRELPDFRIRLTHWHFAASMESGNRENCDSGSASGYASTPCPQTRYAASGFLSGNALRTRFPDYWRRSASHSQGGWL